MTTTALAIITASLQELGVIGAGETPDGSDLQDCLTALNGLMDAYLTAPNNAYTNTIVSASLPAATQSLTIGTSQTFNCARPVRLENPGCYVRVGDVDYPLEVISQADYNAISMKTAAGAWPTVCMLDGGSPTGNVYFWPTGACTVKLLTRTSASQFASLSTAYTLPPGLGRLLKFALMEEMAGPYSRPLSQLQVRNAAQAKRMFKRANFKVPQLDMGYAPASNILNG